MYKEIMIDRVDGQNIKTPLLANAATSRRYKMIFGDDLLTLLANAESNREDGGTTYNIDFIGELAYVMNLQAQAAVGEITFDKMNADGFIDWLEQFEGMAIETAAKDIIDVYVSNANGGSEVKKNRGRRKEN